MGLSQDGRVTVAQDPTGSKDRETHEDEAREAREALSEGADNKPAFSFGPPTEAIVAQGDDVGHSRPLDASGDGHGPSERRTLADAVGIQPSVIPTSDTPEEGSFQQATGSADAVSNADSVSATESISPVMDSGASASQSAQDSAEHNGFASENVSDSGSGGDEPVDSGMTKGKRRKWPWITAFVVVLLAGGYVGAGYYFADRVPAGTTVAGIELGGLDRVNAVERLDEGIADQLSAPVQVVAAHGGEPVTINPADYSLGIDKDATLNSIVGFSLDPSRIWAHISGGEVVDPVLTYDETQLSTLVENLATEANTEPVDASLAFEGTEPTVTPGTQGSQLNVEQAQEVLSSQVLSLEQPIELPVEAVDPVITTEAAENAVAELAQPLVSDKISVMLDERVVELTPEQLAAAATFGADGDHLVLTMDGGKLGDLVRAAIPDAFKDGVDARIEIVNHTTPTVIPSEDGVGIDDAELGQKVAEVGVTTDRTVEIETTTIPAAFTTEDANAMGIKEVVSSIETPLTNDSVRTTNLEVGTQRITNTLVKPEETFSLTEALGPIDAEHGFVSSGVVANGFNSEAMGGGLSQLSTNTFNIGYLAGLTDVEHQPHSKYFDRYPMGREATLWEGSIDMRWMNNTPYGVVIDTWVADGQVHSQLWSTKYWDVETSTSAPYAYVSPTTKTNTAWDCVPSGAGGPGFTVTVSRTVSHDGVVNEEDSGSYNWTYQPVHAVTCG